MFRQYRKLEPGEFFVVFGDCAQGGEDTNFVQFLSKTKADIPLVLQMQSVAAEMTPYLREALNWIYEKTRTKPLIALERSMGGSSEMHNLIKYNEGKYSIYYTKNEIGEPTDKPGFDTTAVSRPKMLGDWLMAYESKAIRIYDQATQDQHQTFIVNKNGKPEAAPNTHDDAVMAAAGAYQLYRTENPAKTTHRRPEMKRLRMHV